MSECGWRLWAAFFVWAGQMPAAFAVSVWQVDAMTNASHTPNTAAT